MANLISTLLLLLLQTNGTIFEIDLWPGEGIPVFEATSRQLLLHEAPSTSSRVTQSVSVTPGQRVAFDDTRYRTVQVGRVRALINTDVKGRRIGKVNHLSRKDYYSPVFPSVDVEVKAGTAFHYLQYRAESTCFVRIDGSVIDAEACPAIDTATFHLEVEPKIEWWIHATVGDVQGWILVDSSAVKEVDRRG
jgi:hypothetical protein